MDNIQELQRKLRKHSRQFSSSDQFRERCRRSHSEPRCKNYKAVEAERYESPKSEHLWRDAYREYLQEQLRLAKFKAANSLETGAIEEMINRGAKHLAEELPFKKYSTEST